MRHASGATCDSGDDVPVSQPLGVDVDVIFGVDNPINGINGNKYQRDGQAALRDMIGLKIVRHWNSLAAPSADRTRPAQLT